jgi:anti-sigma factor RsiW
MKEEHWQELMHRELDGANSPEESAALRSHLAANEDARRQFDELGRVVRMFADAGDVNPPASMEARIIDAIAARHALVERERGFFLDFLSPRRKIAYAFATGIAVGIIVFIIVYQALNGGNQLDVRDLYGTLAERERAGAVIDAQSAAIAVPGLTGTAIVQYRDQAVIVSAAVDAETEVEIEISPAGALVLRSVRAPECGPYALRGSAEGVAVRVNGRCEFVAVFGDAKGERPPVSVRVTGAEGALFERTFLVGRN